MSLFFIFLLSHLFDARAAAPIEGYADLHNHLFAELGMGGGWLHGRVEGLESQAMAGCDGNEQLFGIYSTHGSVNIPFISWLIAKVHGATGDTGYHPRKKSGYPDYKSWPRWDTLAHQQSWEGHLKHAHQNGLVLTVASVVSFEFVCHLIPKRNRYVPCSEYESAMAQIDAIHRFAKNNSDWVEIAKTGSEARKIIESKKMAIVISVEMSTIFENKDWQKVFDELYSKGVRGIQIVHQVNNRFGGAALHNGAFRVIQWVMDFQKAKGWSKLWFWKHGFDVDDQNRNLLGLSDEGKKFILKTIQKGMPIDMAHMSEAMITDLKSITQKYQNFPVYISHGHIKERMLDQFGGFEKSSSRMVLDYIRQSGGIFGLRTGPNRAESYEKSKVENNCDGSSKSFAQTYGFLTRELKVKTALGSDVNGFIQQATPRFGAEACASAVNADERLKQAQMQKNPLGKRYDESGLGHVGQLSDFIKDIQNQGESLKELERSAEDFIQMWERAEHISKKLN